MTQSYPDICPQTLADEPWWEECTGNNFSVGRLVYSFLPHVDQTPYTIKPKGRKEATDCKTAVFQIKAFKIGDPVSKRGLPVAPLPLYGKEMFYAYRAKERPAIIISKGGPDVGSVLPKGHSKWRSLPTVLLAPSYSAGKSYTEEFCDRVRRCEYPQFYWDRLPVSGKEGGSIIRFDHIQPVVRKKRHIKLTNYKLSEKAVEFILQWVEWLVTGRMNVKSTFCETRSFLMES